MSKKIEKIILVGAGNVSTHLAFHLSKRVNIEAIVSKNNSSAQLLSKKIGCPWLENFTSIPSCDLVLICSNDSSIKEIIDQIPSNFKIAYTSGSVELNTLPLRENLGVFYPLQTFSKERDLEISNVPFLIEATNPNFAQELFDLALLLSSQVSFTNSEDRKRLHLSAIFINNFVNHLAYISKQLADKNGVNWNYLKPLIEETTNKIISSDLYDSQTGPARRNDTKIIQEHLSILEGFPKEIYKLLSESIQNTYSTVKKHD